ncbi:hypothetical protein TNCV_1691891 [Trichonephila clavipes]|nr:hypothetical protein TNCV_1691891 [Trichonephila clavipes]
MRLMEVEERGERPHHTHSLFFPKIGVEPSQIVLSPAWCLKLQLTTDVLTLRRIKLRGPLSDYNVNQEASETTTANKVGK